MTNNKPSEEDFYCGPCDTKFSVPRGNEGLCPMCGQTDGAWTMEGGIPKVRRAILWPFCTVGVGGVGVVERIR